MPSIRDDRRKAVFFSNINDKKLFRSGLNLRNGYGTAHGDDLLQLFTMPSRLGGRLPAPMGTGPQSDRDKVAARR